MGRRGEGEVAPPFLKFLDLPLGICEAKIRIRPESLSKKLMKLQGKTTGTEGKQKRKMNHNLFVIELLMTVLHQM